MTNEQNPFAMIAVGAVMLIIGILVGYFAHPLVSETSTETAATLPTASPVVANAATLPTASPVVVTATPEPGSTDIGAADEPADDPTANDETAAPPAVIPSPAPPPTPSEADMQELMSFLVGQTRHFKGDPDAPVTIIEFSDFQCGYCGRFATETAPQIDESYVEDGIVRIGYQHFPFLGEASLVAAEASECAAEQDAFWEYHDLVFERITAGSRDFSQENLQALAAEMELDTAAFGECLASGRYQETIMSEAATAQSIGVGSTPTFLVNGEPVIGAQPFQVFSRIIEQSQTERAAE